MGLRGPKPDQKPKAKSDRPRFAIGEPDRPEWLSEAARLVWDRVIAELKSAKTLAKIDGDMIAAYASAVADLAAISRALEADGVVIEIETTDRNGKPTGHVIRKTNPLLKSKGELLGRVGVLAAALGIGPVSRTRVNVNTPHQAATPENNKVLGIREKIEAARRN